MGDLSDSLISSLRTWDTLVPLAIIAAGFIDGIIGIGFLVNGALLGTLAVYFLSQRIVSFPELMFYALLGASLGDHAGYWIGRCLGDRPFSWWPLKQRPHLREKMDHWLKRHGVLALTAGRFFAPTRSVAPFLAAAFGMTYRDFAFANLLACTSWVLVWSVVVLLIVEGYWSLSF